MIFNQGFGVVHRAKYRFDDHEYAVKMIRFKYTDKYDQVFKKIIREVQLYANLSSHPNVVAYKTAWLENWCLHQETLPLSKHLKISKELGASLTNGDTYALDDSLNTNFPQRNSETDVSIRFEESSKSGLRIESSNRSNSRKTSSEYKHKQMTIDYREVRDESDQEESSSSDEESSDSDQSVETFRLQSFDDLTSIRSPIKRKKTISMSSTQSQSDSAIEYRQCVQVQKFAKPDAIPEITIESCHPNGCPFSCSDFGAILYIQMELCGKNLKTWLRERNDRIFIRLNELVSEGKIDKKTSPVFLLSDCEKKEAKNIFRQVLKGVEYIHSQHLIHRDLKPQNILFSIDGSKVKIGDFGLATLHNSNQVIHPNIAQNRQFWQTSTDPTSIPTSATYENGNDLTHTGNIGTSIYASPEQKNRKDYDHKTDIFSLGLILFELFYPLSTEMEKVKCVSNITKKQCLPPSLRESSENVAKIITAMTHPNSALRPNASEVLHSSLFLSEEQMIIRQMEDQNKQIIKELSLKDNKIRELENSLQIERQKRIEMELAIEKMRKDMEAMGKQLKTSLANGFWPNFCHLSVADNSIVRLFMASRIQVILKVPFRAIDFYFCSIPIESFIKCNFISLIGFWI